jgi:hypothetical protein
LKFDEIEFDPYVRHIYGTSIAMERVPYIEFIEQFGATLRSRREGRLQTQQYQQQCQCVEQEEVLI